MVKISATILIIHALWSHTREVFFFCYVDIVGVPNCNIDGLTSSIIEPRPTDAKERKRQRDRDRYAQMDSTKKDELLKRQRETHQKRKSSTRNKENEVPHEDSEWLSRNDTYQRQHVHMPSQVQESIMAGMMATNSWLK